MWGGKTLCAWPGVWDGWTVPGQVCGVGEPSVPGQVCGVGGQVTVEGLLINSICSETPDEVLEHQVVVDGCSWHGDDGLPWSVGPVERAKRENAPLPRSLLEQQ